MSMDEANNAVTIIFFFVLKWHYVNTSNAFTYNDNTYNN